MKIIIESPQMLESERTKLLNEAIELIKMHERSCKRYAERTARIRNKIRVIEKKLGNS